MVFLEPRTAIKLTITLRHTCTRGFWSPQQGAASPLLHLLPCIHNLQTCPSILWIREQDTEPLKERTFLYTVYRPIFAVITLAFSGKVGPQKKKSYHKRISSFFNGPFYGNRII